MPANIFQLQRLTTNYSDIQDRLRLNGICSNNNLLCMWMSQRLANRLVTSLVEWLEKQELKPATAAAIHAAGASVTAVDAGQPKHEWLVENVNLKFGEQSLEMALCDGSQATCAKISVSREQLLQWLGILQNQYFLADWPTSNWPQSIQGQAAKAVTSNQTMH